MFFKLVIVVVISVCSLVSAFVFESSLPPRFQWVNNDGYCGEVSTIAAGLKYGQYFSQYDLRDIATGSQLKEYLVGVNDQFTAKAVGLNSVAYAGSPNSTTEQYLGWVKQMTRNGYAVTITVYMNYYLFYGITSPSAGDAEYDHIVSVSRIESNYDDDLYHDDDLLVMSDHGLWAPRTTGPVYLFNYTFSSFVGTRQDANAKNGNVYTLPFASKSTCSNYGIAHSGVLDANAETLPVSIATSVNYESPEIDNRSEKRPESMPVTLSITVSDITSGQTYNLYRYDDESKVPTSKFNAAASKAVEVVSFKCCSMENLKEGTFSTNSSYTITRDIESSAKVIFRAVPASAS